jgi:hypothetical protein
MEPRNEKISEGNSVRVIELSELKPLLNFYDCQQIDDEILHEIASNTVEIITIPTAVLSNWDGMIQVRTPSQKEIMLPFAALLGDEIIEKIINPDLDDQRYTIPDPVTVTSDS